MRRPFIHLVPLLILAIGGACSRHPTYGRPMPRDTVPTTKEPNNPKPDRKAPTQPPV